MKGVAAGEAGRVLHHEAFYDRPSVRTLSHSKAAQSSYRLGLDRQDEKKRQDVFVTGTL